MINNRRDAWKTDVNLLIYTLSYLFWSSIKIYAGKIGVAPPPPRFPVTNRLFSSFFRREGLMILIFLRLLHHFDKFSSKFVPVKYTSKIHNFSSTRPCTTWIENDFRSFGQAPQRREHTYSWLFYDNFGIWPKPKLKIAKLSGSLEQQLPQERMPEKTCRQKWNRKCEPLFKVW